MLRQVSSTPSSARRQEQQARATQLHGLTTGMSDRQADVCHQSSVHIGVRFGEQGRFVSGDVPRFRRVSSGRSFDLVFKELRRAIASGALESGQKLPAEPELAKQLGVSRTVLREALKVLEVSGDIEVRRGYGGGTFVAEREGEEFTVVRAPSIPRTTEVTRRQLYDVRMAVEPYAARLAAAAPAADLAGLYETVRHHRSFTDRPAHVLAAAVDLHVAVAKAAGNPVFVVLLEGLRPVMYRAMNVLVRKPSWSMDCLVEHNRIVKEIESGDPDRAESAMREHLTGEWSEHA
jgi:GntR family transcriptional regulator, transcriptional repressor for pyruvate dehydrogenase complex